MVKYLPAILALLLSISGLAQNFSTEKNTFYAYWGWNASGYTKSDISFSGNGYDFVLENVEAKDRPSDFSIEKYFGIRHLTIPQYNFRLGYVFRENFEISFGVDHMKYVMVQNQESRISGTIANSSTEYDGSYSNDPLVLSTSFLEFEHTDGLNYGHLSLRHFSNLWSSNSNVLQLAWTQGVGLGLYLPRSDVELLKYGVHDEFHLAGYGFNAVLGLRLSFFESFFIQTELKGGYVNLPDIISGPGSADRAKQNFFFLERMLVFGSYFRFNKKGKRVDRL